MEGEQIPAVAIATRRVSQRVVVSRRKATPAVVGPRKISQRAVVPRRRTVTPEDVAHRKARRANHSELARVLARNLDALRSFLISHGCRIETYSLTIPVSTYLTTSLGFPNKIEMESIVVAGPRELIMDVFSRVSGGMFDSILPLNLRRLIPTSNGRYTFQRWQFCHGAMKDFYNTVTRLFGKTGRVKRVSDPSFNAVLSYTDFVIGLLPATEIVAGKLRNKAINYIGGKNPGRPYDADTLRMKELRKNHSYGQIAAIFVDEESPNLHPVARKNAIKVKSADVAKKLQAMRDSERSKNYFRDSQKLFMGLRRGDEISILEIDGGKEPA